MCHGLMFVMFMILILCSLTCFIFFLAGYYYVSYTIIIIIIDIIVVVVVVIVSIIICQVRTLAVLYRRIFNRRAAFRVVK